MQWRYLVQRARTFVALCSVAVLSVANPAHAQSVPSSTHAPSAKASAPVLSAIATAKSLADAGDGGKARTLLDSLVATAERDSYDAGEVLYWRALLSEESGAAERDWKRIVVDIPHSPRAPEALLRLSELDMLHKNPAIARQHVQRLLNDYPDSPERAKGLLVLAQSYFSDNDAPRACGAIWAVRKEAPLSAVEVRLQADEMQQQCRGVREVALGAATEANVMTTNVPSALPVVATGASLANAAPPARTASGTLVTPTIAGNPPGSSGSSGSTASTSSTGTPGPLGLPGSPSSKPPATPPAAAVTPPKPTESAPAVARTETPARNADAPARATGKFTVQVAAYDTRAQADALVKRLATRKMTAQVAGTRKPFRVQVGRYATRADATAALGRMKKSGQKGFVAEVGKP